MSPLPQDTLDAEDRRQSGKVTCTLIDDINSRLNEGDNRMTRMELKIDSNSADTSEVLEIVRMGKSFFKVMGHLASFAKYCAVIGGGVATIWGLWPKK